MFYFSKSKYCLAWQCPKLLWLNKYKPELKPVDESLEARFEEGNTVGDLAVNLFGDFTEVTAYTKGFECGRIKELAATFPDLANHLMNIQGNIKDLLTPFQSGYYYNKAMSDSFSIKSVLPALFPDDPALDYHNLEQIHNGGEAMSIFPRIKDMPPEEQQTTRHNLLEYCKLDTYTMVKVLEKLKEVIE